MSIAANNRRRVRRHANAHARAGDRCPRSSCALALAPATTIRPKYSFGALATIIVAVVPVARWWSRRRRRSARKDSSRGPPSSGARRVATAGARAPVVGTALAHCRRHVRGTRSGVGRILGARRRVRSARLVRDPWLDRRVSRPVRVPGRSKRRSRCGSGGRRCGRWPRRALAFGCWRHRHAWIGALTTAVLAVCARARGRGRVRRSLR